ncbi:homeobox protein NANOG-like [Platysternon megacephalum]|uniref:Homeobox protein NANOG-like n=1 Tax=Platysternon megacephalum TaxID=55544 RepID=A0A4D9DQZ5_9SAUR|nr:homeobox protein NANOG-like [Platysternon megacephalum]
MERSGAQLLVCFLLTVLIWVHEIPAVSFTRVTARTLSPCYSANLTPTSDGLISAVGCTVVFSPPGLNFSTGIVRWDYKNVSSTVLSIMVYFKEQSKVDLHPSYNGNVEFSKTHWTLQIKLRLGDGGMYRFRTNSHETQWFQLEVIEPLSQPELRSNSSLVGSTIEFVCKVPVGKVDSYQWKKDGKRLPEDSRFLLFQNDSILCILNTALSDNGVYTCEVSNQVSWNETSLKLGIQNPSNVVVGVVVGVIVVIVIFVLVAVLYVSRKRLKCPTQCFCGDSDLRHCLPGGRSSGPGGHVDCREQTSPSSGTPETTVALLDRNPLDSERHPNQASAAS